MEMVQVKNLLTQLIEEEEESIKDYRQEVEAYEVAGRFCEADYYEGCINGTERVLNQLKDILKELNLQ